MRLPLPAALAFAILLAASACSGTGPTVTALTPTATPSGAATSAAPTPATAAPTRTGPSEKALSRGLLSAWKPCGGGFSCATLTVRLDDTKPSLGTIAIALTRHRATSSNRVGSLVINPGGPGASAVQFLQAAYTSMPATIRSHFDLVAFDPRGVGRTAPVRCLSTAELDAYFHVDPTPDNPSELAAFDAANKRFAQGCAARSGRVLPYVSTKVVAQDLERVRIAVGDPKLTYLGYSYGTSIGAAYLDQFPDHVRAMVLDGALDPTLTWDQLLAGQSRGFDVALGAFLDNCHRTSCAFRKVVQGDLLRAYDALAARVESKPLRGDGRRTVGPQEFLLGVGQALYSRSLWPTLAAGLAGAQQGEGDGLLSLSDAYTERSDRGYENLNEAINAVSCLDRPWPRTDAPYLALAKEVGKKYPRFGPAIALSGGVCEFWSLAPVSTPHKVVAATSPAVVVIGTTRDPATPYSWSQALASQLAHGVLLTHVGDGHTAYRSSAPACITQPVNDYLVSLKVPAAARC